MLQSPTKPSISHDRIISTLTRLRQEWQEATDGVSLLETNGNMGLILADLINGLRLPTGDQRQILGTELFRELSDVLYQPA
ncbi:MAG: hypothetical protein ACM3PS_12510 [Syntrophothermus sp.]|jgi:hypothetical protein